MSGVNNGRLFYWPGLCIYFTCRFLLDQFDEKCPPVYILDEINASEEDASRRNSQESQSLTTINGTTDTSWKAQANADNSLASNLMNSLQNSNNTAKEEWQYPSNPAEDSVKPNSPAGSPPPAPNYNGMMGANIFGNLAYILFEIKSQ